MIPKVVRSKDGRGSGGRGFRGLLSYVCEKADAVEVVNLAGGWQAAPSQMRLVANTNPRCEKPAYHVVISWHEHERPTDAQMIEAARAALVALDASEHQAVIGTHRDRDHHHVHIVINRVHPISGKTLSTSHDFAKLEKMCREIEHRQYWTVDRGRFDVELDESADRPTVRLVPKPPEHWVEKDADREDGRRPDSRIDLVKEKRSGQAPLKDDLIAVGMKDRVAAAMNGETWHQVHADLEALGLEYRPHGSGARLYIRGTVDFVSPSHIGKAYGWKPMTSRLGDFHPAPARASETTAEREAYQATVRAEAAQPDGKQRFKAQLIADAYRGMSMREHLIEQLRRVDLAGYPPRLFFKDGTQVRDEGQRITANKSSQAAAESIVEIGKAKGWTAMTFTGNREFLDRAAREATLRGIEVANADAQQRKIIEQTRREMSQRPAPDTYAAERQAAADQAERNRAERQRQAEERRRLHAEQKVRREGVDELLTDRGPIGQAVRQALDGRDQAERKRLQERQQALERVKPGDLHGNLHDRARRDPAARQRLDAVKSRQTIRDNNADELEAIRRLDLRLVAARLGYREDPAASKEAGPSYVAMRKGADAIKAIEKPDGWVWTSNKSQQSGGVIQLWQAETGANLGQLRRDLRPLVGAEPTKPAQVARESAHETPRSGDSGRKTDHTAVRQQWQAAAVQGDGLPDYAVRCGFTADILNRFSDQIRIGHRGALMFAHRDGAGGITGFEVKSPGYTGFASGGNKALCELGDRRTATRIVVTETAIDALSVAQIERRSDTLYVSPGGTPVRRSINQLRELAVGRAIVMAQDADQTGDATAAKLRQAVQDQAVGVERMRPPEGRDWNDELRAGVERQAERQREAERSRGSSLGM